MDNKDILSHSMEKYIGGSVENFVSDSIIKNYTDYLFIDEKPGELSCVSFIYPNNVNVDIVIDDYKYLNRFSEDRTWNFDILKRERIDMIKVYKNDCLVKDIQEIHFINGR